MQIDIPDIVGILTLAIIILGGGYMVINQVIQERAQNKIENFLNSYRTMAKKHNLDFHLFSYSSDPTPGTDIIVKFTGPTVEAEVTPAQALRFLETLQKGAPDIGYLEKKSKWPASPVLF